MRLLAANDGDAVRAQLRQQRIEIVDAIVDHERRRARTEPLAFLARVVWAVFAGCIVAIPALTALGHLGAAAWLIGIVSIEVLVLALNGLRCPLTDVAARYTRDRRANFDIHLPLWLAQHNKTVFGALYVIGIGYTAWVWFGRG